MSYMIYIGADHAGYKLKERIRSFLEKKNISYTDISPHLDKEDDYPDIAKNVGLRVKKAKTKGDENCF